MKSSQMVKHDCPMHPEVVSDKPGNCPKCGMDLVETGKDDQAGKPDHHDHSEHHAMMAEDFKKRFFVSLPVTFFILVLSPQIQAWLGFSLEFVFKDLLLFILGTAMVVYGAKPFYKAAREELVSRNYGMMTLVSLAVTSAYLFSVASTYIFQGKSFYWEVATLVLAFLFGHWVEMRAVVGTGGALKELAKLIPPVAHKLLRGKPIDVKTEELEKGDFVLIKPGEKVPTDGVVMEGISSVNEAMITGESKPVNKTKGDKVIGGTINNDGALTVKVTNLGEASALSQIMELIRGAQQTKPAVQNLADRAANWLTITAIVVGISTFFFWLFVNPQGAIFASTLAITVVVITCPHALGLAIPTVTTITTSLAAKNGILIRDMKGLEVAKDLDYVVFDKTGTLTEGNFVVSNISPSPNMSGITKNELLRLAAAVEISSEHSIAKAIVEEAKKRKIKFTKASKFTAFPGKGATGIVGSSRVAAGNKALLRERGFKMSDLRFETEGSETVVFVGKERELMGVITLEDAVRPESKKSVNKLNSMGVKTVMLSGDKRGVAEKVAKKLGIDKVFAEVLPRDKTEKIKELQKGGQRVAMVGDGVNDAPSLTQADVGIAIGAGTDVAVSSAEIVLVKNNPLDVVKTIRLSRAVSTKMKQNLAWAAGYNLIAIPVAAGVLFPFGILLRPEWGALLMSTSSIIVVANALRLRSAKL